ncbi:hypothetical protein LWI28_003321 [Acer negundo]|uniref:Uncharacterized protein n=1 Tax=Acer negundo TaxID=4023 RepID=A0AAD5INX4_ACENE|nr:hypothetical protein LWI28_003321 [Acer negundo]
MEAFIQQRNGLQLSWISPKAILKSALAFLKSSQKATADAATSSTKTALALCTLVTVHMTPTSAKKQQTHYKSIDMDFVCSSFIHRGCTAQAYQIESIIDDQVGCELPSVIPDLDNQETKKKKEQIDSLPKLCPPLVQKTLFLNNESPETSAKPNGMDDPDLKEAIVKDVLPNEGMEIKNTSEVITKVLYDVLSKVLPLAHNDVLPKVLPQTLNGILSKARTGSPIGCKSMINLESYRSQVPNLMVLTAEQSLIILENRPANCLERDLEIRRKRKREKFLNSRWIDLEKRKKRKRVKPGQICDISDDDDILDPKYDAFLKTTGDDIL